MSPSFQCLQYLNISLIIIIVCVSIIIISLIIIFLISLFFLVICFLKIYGRVSQSEVVRRLISKVLSILSKIELAKANGDENLEIDLEGYR